jgi:DNA-directed RNA polymerase subunit H (RpoH/RPB5)
MDEDIKVSKCWSNLLKMLEKRGYNISSLPTKETIKNNDKLPNSISVVGPIKLYVFFTLENIKSQFADKTVSDLKKKNEPFRLILIGKQISKSVKNYLKAYKLDEDIIIESFSYEELMIDITKHKLSDKYEICTKEKKEELILQYRLIDIKKDIPSLKESDPQCKYIGALDGDIICVRSLSANVPEIDGVPAYNFTYKYVTAQQGK